MNRIRHFFLVMAVVFFSCCTLDHEATARTNQTSEAMKINITIDGQTMIATLADNSSAQALYEALQQGNIAFEAHDYGDFEKVGDMGRSFPQNNEPITTQPGDLILYLGNHLCIYYDTNSWNFTRLGRIDGATQSDVKSFVKAGQGNVTIILSAPSKTSISQVSADKESGKIYAMNGVVLRQEPTKGIYIKNGKKFIR